MLTSQTRLISSWPWNLCGKRVSLFFFSPLYLDITKLWLSKSFAALSLTLLKVILPLQFFLFFPAVVVVSGRQKDDNVWVIDRILIGPFYITVVSGRSWAEEPEQWTGNSRFIFLLPSSRAQCLVGLAWLIKGLLRRFKKMGRTLQGEISIPSEP